MRRNARRVVIGLLLAAGVFCATSGNVGAQPASPRRVVMAFYPAFYQSENEALSLMSAPLAAQVKQSGGVAKFVHDRTGGINVRGVQTLKEQITDQTAVVSYILHLVDGTTKKCEDNLVLENGAWKLTVPPVRRK